MADERGHDVTMTGAGDGTGVGGARRGAGDVPAPAADAACDEALLARARAALRETFGHDDFRPSQLPLVQRVLAGRDVLGVMPTGAGKSMVYQIPAIILPGTTIVVSPLISLMKDQVEALLDAGVAACCLTSAQTAEEREATLAQVRAGACKLLYVAPERLGDQRFLAVARSLEIPLVAVDEAHCVSQWGQDFRPSYLGIADFVAGLPSCPCVCALTATATARVRADIVEGLRLDDPFTFVSGFDRPNLYFGVERPEPRDKDACLLHLVTRRVQAGQSGIVYCSTRRAVEDVCRLLRDHGVAAGRYHAGLAADERAQAQEDFAYDRTPVIVATNAFGMGIDKSNVSFVIHYNMPGDLESYYQEAGRAGRDGEPADCILIYNKRDVATQQFLISKSYDEAIANGVDPQVAATTRQTDSERLRQMTIYCTTTDCLRSTILRYFGETDAPFRCEHCSNCSTDFTVEDATVEAQKVISCVLRLAQRNRSVGKALIVDILRGSRSERVLGAHYDELSTYGIMADASARRVRYVLDACVDRGLLEVSDDRMPTVHATPAAHEFLRTRASFQLKVPRRLPRVDPTAVSGDRHGVFGTGGRGGAGAGTSAPIDASDLDNETLERLRQVRTRLAREAGVPAYIVCSNATLVDMWRRAPRTMDELLQVSGIGVSKAQKYGAAFLACLNGEAEA